MRINLGKGRKIEITVRQNEKGDYEYYIENLKIGVYAPKIMKDNIMFLEKVKINDDEITNQIKDVINSKSQEEIHKESQEIKEIDTYMRNLGERDISKNKIRIIDLEREKENQEEQKEIEEKNIDSKENKGKNEEKIEKATTKDVNVKQEIELDERANDMKSLRQWLGGNVPKNITKIGVIESDQMDEMKDENGKTYQRPSTRYSLVAINKNSEVEPLNKYLPELQQRSEAGNNPTQEQWQVNKDGNVKKDAVLSEYELGDKIMQIDNDEGMGRIRVNIGEEERAGTQTMGMEMRDSNDSWVIDVEVRKTMGEYERNGEDTVEKNIEEAGNHEENDPNCSKMTHEDIDGDLDTKSQHVIDKEKNQVEELISKILEENDEIAEVYNREDVKNKFKEVAKNNKEQLTLKEIAEKVAKEMNEEAENEHTPRGQENKR